MILKLLIANLIITFGLLLTGNIGWAIVLHIFNTCVAVADHVLTQMLTDDEEGEQQPPSDDDLTMA